MNKAQGLNIFLLIVAGILLYILFADKCTPSKTKPVVIKGKDIIQQTNLAVEEKKRMEDSFNLVSAKYEDEIREKGYSYDELMQEFLTQQDIMDGVFKNPIPDTCKGIVTALTNQYNVLKAFSDRKDQTATSLIGSLKDLNEHQKKFLAQKDSSYVKMMAICDTCAKALIQNEKYIAKISPKREINVGLEVNSSYLDFKPNLGIGLGYRGKTGLQVNMAVYSNKTITVGIKKTLFKF